MVESLPRHKRAAGTCSRACLEQKLDLVCVCCTQYMAPDAACSYVQMPIYLAVTLHAVHHGFDEGMLIPAIAYCAINRAPHVHTHAHAVQMHAVYTASSMGLWPSIITAVALSGCYPAAAWRYTCLSAAVGSAVWGWLCTVCQPGIQYVSRSFLLHRESSVRAISPEGVTDTLAGPAVLPQEARSACNTQLNWPANRVSSLVWYRPVGNYTMLR